MTPISRRNACPTIARPMETGDGLLARLPPTGPLSADAIRVVGEAAQRFGNGIIEVTARGSIQVRGLTAATTPHFAEALAAARFTDARPAILAPPLAGHDPEEIIDVRPLVLALRDAVAAKDLGAQLAAKTSVAIDGGGALHLDAIDADVRLVATSDSAFRLAVGGTAATAHPVGVAAADRAVDAALAVLRMIADLGPGARGRDLYPSAVLARVDAGPEDIAAAPRPPAEAVGTHALRNGTVAVGVGLPFGQTDAAILAALVDAAQNCGAVAFAPAEGRSLLALGIAGDRIARFRDRATALGFIVGPDDPRRSVVACAGAPACSAGLMPARAIAAEVAGAAAPILDGSVTLHISGCAKGCAHPRAATLTFVGGERGAGLVVAGRAGDASTGHLPASDLPASVSRLVAIISAAQWPGEPAAATIARLGTDRLARSLLREPADA